MRGVFIIILSFILFSSFAFACKPDLTSGDTVCDASDKEGITRALETGPVTLSNGDVLPAGSTYIGPNNYRAPEGGGTIECTSCTVNNRQVHGGVIIGTNSEMTSSGEGAYIEGPDNSRITGTIVYAENGDIARIDGHILTEDGVTLEGTNAQEYMVGDSITRNNILERVSGIDINGDGVVGAKPVDPSALDTENNEDTTGVGNLQGAGEGGPKVLDGSDDNGGSRGYRPFDITRAINRALYGDRGGSGSILWNMFYGDYDFRKYNNTKEEDPYSLDLDHQSFIEEKDIDYYVGSAGYWIGF